MHCYEYATIEDLDDDVHPWSNLKSSKWEAEFKEFRKSEREITENSDTVHFEKNSVKARPITIVQNRTRASERLGKTTLWFNDVMIRWKDHTLEVEVQKDGQFLSQNFNPHEIVVCYDQRRHMLMQ